MYSFHNCICSNKKKKKKVGYLKRRRCVSSMSKLLSSVNVDILVVAVKERPENQQWKGAGGSEQLRGRREWLHHYFFLHCFHHGPFE